MSRHRLVLLAGVPMLLFACLLALVATKSAPVLRLDAAISDQALRAALAHPGWRAVMAAVTVTGGPAVGITAAVLGVLGLVLAGRRRDAGFVAAAALTSTVMRLIVLNTVDRPRPALRLTATSGWSFPSGHTTSAAVTAMVVIVVGRPLLARAWQRRALTAAALAWAAAVGVSRVALVAHWPTDVLAAWLMVTGIVVALLALRQPHDLLLLARVDDSGLRLRRLDVDLDDLVYAERERLALQHPALKLEGAVEPVRVTGDPDHLHRVLRNLVDNAARHARHTVTISLTTTDGAGQVVVGNDGPPIAVQDREKIFDRFVRLDDSRSRQGGGAGLGLPIAREIVAAHGGTLTVAAQETGAVLLIRLPLPS